MSTVADVTPPDGTVDPRQPGREENRRHVRHAIVCPAVCSIEQRQSSASPTWDAIIVDVSEGGFGLSCDLPLDVEARLWITVAGVGSYPCRLAWKRDDRCGLQLLDSADELPSATKKQLSLLFAP